MTLSEAFLKSIIRWQAIVADDGENDYGSCVMCEHRRESAGEGRACEKCPLRGEAVSPRECCDGLYAKWHWDGNKENAQAVLDYIIQQGIKHSEVWVEGSAGAGRVIRYRAEADRVVLDDGDIYSSGDAKFIPPLEGKKATKVRDKLQVRLVEFAGGWTVMQILEQPEGWRNGDAFTASAGMTVRREECPEFTNSSVYLRGRSADKDMMVMRAIVSRDKVGQTAN